MTGSDDPRDDPDKLYRDWYEQQRANLRPVRPRDDGVEVPPAVPGLRLHQRLNGPMRGWWFAILVVAVLLMLGIHNLPDLEYEEHGETITYQTY